MDWWKRRTAFKRAREMVAGTRKLMRMHRDVIEPRHLQTVSAAADGLAAAAKAGNLNALDELADQLDKKFETAFPREPHAAWRENIEVFLVAAIVAMAVRTFFIQPFKIPTGSMQPTLYGVYPGRFPESQPQPPIPYSSDLPAPLSETVSQLGRLCQNLRTDVPSQVHRPSLPVEILGTILTGTIFEPEGYRTRGDHIFVDRFTYHFRKPYRGEVIVFDTSDIDRLGERSRGKFFIKRLIGLGGDTIQVHPPYVLVNDKIPDGLPYRRNYSCQNGYNGYVIPDAFPQPAFINSPNSIYTVPDKHLFVLGDNSISSLDGRFWGSLPDKALIGRAVFVYWPFSIRFGFFDKRQL